MAFYEIIFQGNVDESGCIKSYNKKEQKHGLLHFDSEHGYFKLLGEDRKALQYLAPGDAFRLEGFRGETGMYIIEDDANGLGIFIENRYTGHLSIDFMAGKGRKPVCIDAIGFGKREFDMRNIKSIQEMPLKP